MSSRHPTYLKLSVTIFSLFLMLVAGGFIQYLAIENMVTAGDSPEARGLAYSGMVLAAKESNCAGNYELLVSAINETLCTHGPDAAPPGIDVRRNRSPQSLEVTQQSLGPQVKAQTVTCTGDGQGGDRVQLVYARSVDKPDNYAAYLNSFQTWAQRMDAVVNESAAKQGGISHIRFVHDGSCVPDVARVQLSVTGDDSFNQTVNEVYAAGMNRGDRKYLIWVDANVYCGLGTLRYDDRPTADNFNNVGLSWARVDNGCWGINDAAVETHEVLHMLGAVQPSAPNSDSEAHCTDEYDSLCYAAVPGVAMRYICDYANERLLDCNGDDYFTAAPTLGSYISTHWNTANSKYLTTVLATYSPTPVYRFWSSTNLSHFYAADYNEAASVVNTYEDREWAYEGVGYSAELPNNCSGKQPVHRFWSDFHKSHFYTITEAEKQYVIDAYSDNIWRYEGVVLCASISQDVGTVPLYRFWSEQYGNHFFTNNEAEKDHVINAYDDSVWRYEGVAYHVQ